jgi:sulfur-oxidizing protein SoxZ
MANEKSVHRIRVESVNGGADVRILLRHPMETGTRKDSVTGITIPRHFIEEIHFEHNGKEVMAAHWSWGMALNPFVSFHIRRVRPGDVVRVHWTDNKGMSGAVEGAVALSSGKPGRA